MLGTLLRNRYRITRQIGAGSFGETYLAEDWGIPTTLKPYRVVKRLKPKVHDNNIIRLFKQEAEVLYKLGNEHSQIPKLLEYFENEGDFFMVQEFIDGEDLTHEIKPNCSWPESRVRELLKEVLEILAYVHDQNIIHRDIKPANIIRRRKDKKLVLIDFGAVKEISTMAVNVDGSTKQTIMIGTLGYMPDEQTAGRPKFASDIYAVGMMAIQALTGISPKSLPVDPDNHEVEWCHLVQIHPDFEAVLRKMTYRDFLQRYSHAREALVALGRLQMTIASTSTDEEETYSTTPVTLTSNSQFSLKIPFRSIEKSTQLMRSTQTKGHHLAWSVIVFLVILAFVVTSPFVHRSITQSKPRNPNSERAF